MSAIRLFARRQGAIDKTVPQVMEEWLSRRTGLEPPGSVVGHHVADHVLHLGYGLGWGAGYGALVGTRRQPVTATGAALGLAVWAVGFLVLVPLLRPMRTPARSGGAEVAVNIGAHLLYGAVTALTVDELRRQPDHGPTSDAERMATRVG